MRDLLRGHVTGRLNYRGLVSDSGLPKLIRDLLLRLSKNLNLRRIEKYEVLEEMLSHFYDGFRDGATEEKLVDKFGDVKQVAVLLTRAKRRTRPVGFKVTQALVGFCGGIVVLYAAAATYTLSKKAEATIDYRAKINARLLAENGKESGWPKLRSVINEYRLNNLSDGVNLSHNPWNRNFLNDQTRNWLKENPGLPNAIREGAQTGYLGLPAMFSWEIPKEDGLALIGPRWKPGIPPENKNRVAEESMAGLLLAHLSKLRDFSKILILDSYLAKDQGDISTIIANYRAQLNLARMCNEQGILINYLLSLRLLNDANRFLGEVLAEHPSAISEQQIQQLVRARGSINGFFNVPIEAEAVFFMDTVQRVYSDDGNGDGFLTVDGIRLLGQFFSDPQNDRLWDQNGLGEIAPVLAAPIIRMKSPSRKEVVCSYRELMDHIADEAKWPLWKVLHHKSEAEKFIQRTKSNIVPNSLKIDLVAFMGVSYQRLLIRSLESQAADNALGVALATHQFRISHERLPESLDELVPDLLEQVPLDQSSGQPLAMKHFDSGLTLYGAGKDLEFNDATLSATTKPASWPSVPENGDWILFPPPAVD